jgi:hypothetical protein
LLDFERDAPVDFEAAAVRDEDADLLVAAPLPVVLDWLPFFDWVWVLVAMLFGV